MYGTRGIGAHNLHSLTPFQVNPKTIKGLVPGVGVLVNRNTNVSVDNVRQCSVIRWSSG